MSTVYHKIPHKKKTYLINNIYVMILALRRQKIVDMWCKFQQLFKSIPAKVAEIYGLNYNYLIVRYLNTAE